MVPAWAAVVIALGASAIGALAGIFGAYMSLRIARLNLDQQASEAWRTRQLEAAEDFSVSWTSALSGVGLVRGAVSGQGDLPSALDSLREKHADGGAKLMRVGLLFGADSAAREAAREALSQVNQASQVLEDFSASSSSASVDREDAIRRCNEHITRSQASHREFVRTAHTDLVTSARPGRRRARAPGARDADPNATAAPGPG